MSPAAAPEDDGSVPPSARGATEPDPNQERRLVTLDLIRKRSEHNDGLVSDLEEISLHQEELEGIGQILGRACGKTLKILLLQNNVVDRMDPSDLRHFRRIEYLNLALNNVRKIEGIRHLEFLEKLDLTLNFIDVDALEVSVDELEGLRSLRELYLMGNPCAFDDGAAAAAAAEGENSGENGDGGGETKPPPRGWPGCRPYVVARLPRLEILDGKEILRTERIRALQSLPELMQELKVEAEKKRRLRNEASNKAKNVLPADGEEAMTEHTPEARAEISREMAQQKAEKEEKETANLPKPRGEKEFEEEQREAVERAKVREEKGDVRQCNEGRYPFKFDEESRPGFVLLDVSVPKHLSSGLLDVDVHPTSVSVVIKSKLLRLVLPAEVRSEESTAQRSTTTGHLRVVMPKVDPEENMVCVRAGARARELARQNKERGDRKEGRAETKQTGGLALQLLEEAGRSLKGPVRIDGLVDESKGGVKQEPRALGLAEVSTSRKQARSCERDDGDDEPPPIF